jgi:hypothetical protein
MKYAGVHLDLAITVVPQAFFVSKYRDETIPGVRIAFAAIGADELRRRVLPSKASVHP